MKTGYGNTFNSGSESVDAGRLSAWVEIKERYPVGAFLAPDATGGNLANGKVKVGEKIPLGTPVTMTSVGATPSFAKTGAVTGFTEEDVYMGTDGCTLTIVTRGMLNVSLVENANTTIPTAVRTAMADRILFVGEYVKSE